MAFNFTITYSRDTKLYCIINQNLLVIESDHCRYQPPVKLSIRFSLSYHPYFGSFDRIQIFVSDDVSDYVPNLSPPTPIVTET